MYLKVRLKMSYFELQNGRTVSIMFFCKRIPPNDGFQLHVFGVHKLSNVAFSLNGNVHDCNALPPHMFGPKKAKELY